MGAARGPSPAPGSKVERDQDRDGHEHASPGWGARLYHRVDLALHFLTRQYERLLAAALRNRLLVLALVGLLFVRAMALLPMAVGIGRGSEAAAVMPPRSVPPGPRQCGRRAARWRRGRSGAE